MAPRIEQEMTGNTIRQEVTVGPEAGKIEGNLDASVGPQLRVSRDGGGTEVAAAVSAEGSVEWPMFQRQAIEQKAPELSLSGLFDGGRIDLGEQHVAYQKLTLGVGAAAEGSFGKSQGVNLYPGLQARFVHAEIAGNANGFASVDWEAHLRTGPAIRSVVSTAEGDRAVGGFLDVGASTCVGEQCDVSLGGGVTAAVYGDAITVTPSFRAEWK